MKKNTRKDKLKKTKHFVTKNGHAVELCSYSVIDLDTGLELLRGAKYRCMSFTVEENTYKKYLFFGPDITIYKRELTIKGRLCAIFYFVGDCKENWGSYVMSAGRLLGLKARYYADLNEKILYAGEFLKRHGYEIRKVKA